MHDPDVVVFDVHVPIPKRSRLYDAKKDAPRWTLGRRHFTSPPEYVGIAIHPWWQPQAWQPRLAGRAFAWCKLCTVWHNEPGGADSGTVCKGMQGSQWCLANVRWAWKHRQHLEVHFVLPRKVKRRLRQRCDSCGRRFRWNESSFGFMSGDKHFHESCSSSNHWRAVAEERIKVFDIVMDLNEGLGCRDVMMVAGLRGDHNDENMVWRVFYDLQKRREALAATPGPPR